MDLLRGLKSEEKKVNQNISAQNATHYIKITVQGPMVRSDSLSYCYWVTASALATTSAHLLIYSSVHQFICSSAHLFICSSALSAASVISHQSSVTIYRDKSMSNLNVVMSFLYICIVGKVFFFRDPVF